MTPELKPCPFCGLLELRAWDNAVNCQNCDATGPDLGHCVGAKCREEAIAAWNRRSVPVASEEMILLMRQALVQARGALRLDAMLDENGEPYGTTTVALEAIEAAEDAITAALSGQTAAPVAVKLRPLEWGHDHIADEWHGNVHVDGLRGYVVKGSRYTIKGTGRWVHCDSTDEAKAAAQADYEQRIRSALATPVSPAPDAGWRDMSSAPKDGTRVLVAWKPADSLSEHVELGKWRSGYGWCNTYSKQFHGDPDAWAPLVPFTDAGWREAFDEMLSALKAVESEILLTGQLADIVDAAISKAQAAGAAK